MKRMMLLKKNIWTVLRIIQTDQVSFYRVSRWTGRWLEYYTTVFLSREEAQKTADRLNEKEQAEFTVEQKVEDCDRKELEKEITEAVAKAVQAETEAYDKPEEEKDTEEEERQQLIQHFKQADVLATAELINRTEILSRKVYRQELKDLLLEAAANATLGEHELGDMYADFGWAVVKKMAAEEIEMTV